MKGAEHQFRTWRDAGGRSDAELLEAASSMRKPRTLKDSAYVPDLQDHVVLVLSISSWGARHPEPNS
eukprot:3741624-Amphidinium_carterae.3